MPLAGARYAWEMPSCCLSKVLPPLGIIPDQCLARQAILDFRVEMMSCC